MYSDDELDAAIAAGALDAAAVARLRAFVAARQHGPVADEEHFRLLTGFNDIFVAIAIVLILIALIWLGTLAHPALGGVLVTAASWALAEYFTRRRRMALPSLLLLLSFVGGVLATSLTLMASDLTGDNQPGAVASSAALTTLAAYGHWRRFMVPVTVAAGAASALGAVLSVIFGLFPGLEESGLMPLVLLGGLMVFALAMRWDARDRARTTRRSDVAFWLHLAAAPLIVHPAFTMLGLLEDGEAKVAHALAAIAIYLALALVALAVDRRALLVSALFYVLYAISALFRAAGSLNESFALTALVIGSALLLLSAFWQRARAPVVSRLPEAIVRRVPAVSGR